MIRSKQSRERNERPPPPEATGNPDPWEDEQTDDGLPFPIGDDEIDFLIPIV